jgi:hypothetical protein
MIQIIQIGDDEMKPFFWLSKYFQVCVKFSSSSRENNSHFKLIRYSIFAAIAYPVKSVDVYFFSSYLKCWANHMLSKDVFYQSIPFPLYILNLHVQY